MKNELLRHTLSTIDYRFQKSISMSDEGFGIFKAGAGSRSSNEIINHMFQVLRATRIFVDKDEYSKVNHELLELKLEIERFNNELKRMDDILSEKELDINYSKRLIQGPFSDILTHIGQISMLSGLYGNPIAREDFSAAKISTGII